MYHFIKNIFAFIFKLIIADVGLGHRFVSVMLFLCPYGITVACNLPYPSGKARWQCAFIQGGNDLKCNVLCQIFCFDIVPRPFQAEVKQLLHIVLGEFVNQPITHFVRFLHFLASSHPYSVAFLNLGAFRL